MKDILRKALKSCVDNNEALNGSDALALLECGAGDVPEIIWAANAVRQRKFGNRITLCSIVNAKSGACEEDCAFCAQSAHHNGCNVECYSLLSQEKLIEAFDQAVEQPIKNFGVVTSGGVLGNRDLQVISKTIATRKHDKTSWCASLGCLNVEQLRELKATGLKRYHHNLETARSFFPQICTTHDYDIRLDTIKAAKEAGLEVCCGGLLGMGESLEQRVEFAQALATLRVDQIPLNFLVPVSGTPLEDRPFMKPLEMLRAIAMFRLVCPEVSLKVAAGRVQLNRLQSIIFYAGCNAMMIGDLLTIAGGDVAEDLQMLEDLELEIVLKNHA